MRENVNSGKTGSTDRHSQTPVPHRDTQLSPQINRSNRRTGTGTQFLGLKNNFVISPTNLKLMPTFFIPSVFHFMEFKPDALRQKAKANPKICLRFFLFTVSSISASLFSCESKRVLQFPILTLPTARTGICCPSHPRFSPPTYWWSSFRWWTSQLPLCGGYSGYWPL